MDNNQSYVARMEAKKRKDQINSNKHWDTMSGINGEHWPAHGNWSAFTAGRMLAGRDPYTGKYPSYGNSISTPITTSCHTSYEYIAMTKEEALQLQKQDSLDFIKIRESQKKYFTNKLTKLLKSYIRNDKLKPYLMSAKPKHVDVIKNLVIGNFPHPSNMEDENGTSKKNEIDILYDKIKHAVDNDNINSVFNRLIKKTPRYYYTEWETALKKVKRHYRLQKLGGLPLITLTGSTLVGIFTGMASVPDSRSANQTIREGGYIAHDVVDAANGLLIRNSPVSREGNIIGKLSNGECIYVRGATTGEWAEISRSPRSEQTKTYVNKNYLRRNAKGICP